MTPALRRVGARVIRWCQSDPDPLVFPRRMVAEARERLRELEATIISEPARTDLVTSAREHLEFWLKMVNGDVA